MLAGAARVVASLRRCPGRGFSWLDWVEKIGRGESVGWVFLGVPERQFAGARALIAAHIEAACSALLSLPPDASRRVWLMLDEFASLPRMEAVPRLLAMGRKFGAVGVLGVQSPSQLAATYGREDATTVAAVAGTQLFLRLPGGEAARWAAQMLGRGEVESLRPTAVLDGDEAGDKTTLARSREVRDLVLDSEFSDLPDLAGFLRVPGVGVGRVHLAHGPRNPSPVPAFVPGDPAAQYLSLATAPRAAPVADDAHARAQRGDENDRGFEVF